MVHRKWTVLGLAAFLGLLAALFSASSPLSGSLLELLTTAGSGLRSLSLSGLWGNLAAWLIVYLLSAPPVIWMLVQWHKREKHPLDILAGLSSLLIALGLYSLVNPTRMAAPIIELAQIWPLDFWTAALSALVCWIILLALDRLSRSEPGQLGSALSALLLLAAALMIFAAVSGCAARTLSLMMETSQGNSADPMFGALDLGFDPSQLVKRTNLLLLVLALLDMVPTLLGALVLLWSCDLVQAVQDSPFSQETVSLSEKMAVWCTRMVQATVAVTLVSNLLQLFAFPHVARTDFSVSIPLLPLLLAAALFLLCRLFQRGNQLQQDSDSII